MSQQPAPNETLTFMYAVVGLDRTLCDAAAHWEGAKFEMTSDLRGTLTLTAPDIRTANQLRECFSTLEATAHRFALALSWRIMQPVSIRRTRTLEPQFNPGKASQSCDRC